MIPTHIIEKIGINLYKNPTHPLYTIKRRILDCFEDFLLIEKPNPLVSVEHNFDSLLVPKDHPSRRSTDTFYNSEDTVLRTHMTCYLCPLAKQLAFTGHIKFMTCGDVYRKDSIDATHYPVFHQMDAFSLMDEGVDVEKDLRTVLTGLINSLFGDHCKFSFLEEKNDPKIYFPFTINSLEVEVELEVNGEKKLVEVLGGGTVHPSIMKSIGLEGRKAWAFGLGLERLAMILFEIPDIRLFWSQDPRFTEQFKPGELAKFKPFSKYEKCYKDIAFFIPDTFHYNELCSVVREEDPNNLIEDISLLDEFKKGEQTSHCYRITYRALNKTLTNQEIDAIQLQIRDKVVSRLNVKLR